MPVKRLFQAPYLNKVSKFIQTKNAVPSKRKEHLSPTGKYRLIIMPYRTGENTWEYSQGTVYNAETDEFIGEVHRNYSSFPFAFIENHPETREDYLICGQNYQGQTVVNLTTKKIEHNLPEKARYGHGFCWAEIMPSPNGKTLAVNGCYWACPYETVIYDFSDPMKMPYPEICRNRDHEELFGWINNTEYEVGRVYDVLRTTGKPEDDMSLEELREIEKIQEEQGLSEEDMWEEVQDKIIFKVPEPKKKKYGALKEKVKSLQEYGMFHRRMINGTKGKARNEWWNKKRREGRETRFHLTAYCLLRKKDYFKMESKIRPENSWQFTWRCRNVHDIIQYYGTEADCIHWTLEQVKQSLFRKNNDDKEKKI